MPCPPACLAPSFGPTHASSPSGGQGKTPNPASPTVCCKGCIMHSLASGTSLGHGRSATRCAPTTARHGPASLDAPCSPNAPARRARVHREHEAKRARANACRNPGSRRRNCTDRPGHAMRVNMAFVHLIACWLQTQRGKRPKTAPCVSKHRLGLTNTMARGRAIHVSHLLLRLSARIHETLWATPTVAKTRTQIEYVR